MQFRHNVQLVHSYVNTRIRLINNLQAYAQDSRDLCRMNRNVPGIFLIFSFKIHSYKPILVKKARKKNQRKKSCIFRQKKCRKMIHRCCLGFTRTDAAFDGWCEACGAKLASLVFCRLRFITYRREKILIFPDSLDFFGCHWCQNVYKGILFVT